MRELVKIELKFNVVNPIKKILKDWYQIFWALLQGFLAVEDLAGNASARFGGSAQTGLAEGGGFHEGIEGFGVVSLPSFVAGFNLNFAALGDI